MVNIRILKATNHLDDRIHLPDMGKKLVPQPFPLARPLDETGNIHQLDRGRHHLLALRHGRHPVQATVGHRDHPHVGLDRAEWVVGRLRLAGAGHRVEKGALPHIRQTDDSGSDHSEA